MFSLGEIESYSDFFTLISMKNAKISVQLFESTKTIPIIAVTVVPVFRQINKFYIGIEACVSVLLLIWICNSQKLEKFVIDFNDAQKDASIFHSTHTHTYTYSKCTHIPSGMSQNFASFSLGCCFVLTTTRALQTKIHWIRVRWNRMHPHRHGYARIVWARVDKIVEYFAACDYNFPDLNFELCAVPDSLNLHWKQFVKYDSVKDWEREKWRARAHKTQ